jgi:hypothetical protein
MEVIKVLFIERVIESVAIKIGYLIVVNIYRPPSGSREIFLQELQSILGTFGQNDIIFKSGF